MMLDVLDAPAPCATQDETMSTVTCTSHNRRYNSTCLGAKRPRSKAKRSARPPDRAPPPYAPGRLALLVVVPVDVVANGCVERCCVADALCTVTMLYMQSHGCTHAETIPTSYHMLRDLCMWRSSPNAPRLHCWWHVRRYGFVLAACHRASPIGGYIVCHACVSQTLEPHCNV